VGVRSGERAIFEKFMQKSCILVQNFHKMHPDNRGRPPPRTPPPLNPPLGVNTEDVLLAWN